MLISRPWSRAVVCAAALTAAASVVLGLDPRASGRNRAAASPATAAPQPPAAGRSPWGAEWFPNVELTTQEGRKVRFFDDLIRGKVVAINFIFTKCRNTCPSETAKMRQVQKLLGDRVGKDVFMYSISLDPHWDTPERLNAYAKKFGVGPGWLFLTGDRKDVDLIQRKLGMFIEDLDDPEDHNVSLIMGNQATGRWQKRSPHDSPRVLASLLGEAMHNYKAGSRVFERPSYEDAEVIPALSRGEYLWRTRCRTCHTIGGSDEIGPDLLGVTEQREREWLMRWLKVPDEMLAEKDPIALALYEKFNEVPMPNLKLGDLEAAALIEYMAAESRRVEQRRASARTNTAAD